MGDPGDSRGEFVTSQACERCANEKTTYSHASAFLIPPQGKATTRVRRACLRRYGNATRRGSGGTYATFTMRAGADARSRGSRRSVKCMAPVRKPWNTKKHIGGGQQGGGRGAVHAADARVPLPGALETRVWVRSTDGPQLRVRKIVVDRHHLRGRCMVCLCGSSACHRMR